MEHATALVDHDATTPRNVYELKARAIKAGKLADVLLGQGATPEEAAALPHRGRMIAAALAGVRRPSKATWNEVVALVACVERGRALSSLVERLEDQRDFARDSYRRA